MKTNCSVKLFSILAVLVLATSLAQAALSTAFTYQGRLVAGGNPANGPFDLQLTLFDMSTGGTQIGDADTKIGVAVSNGLFTTTVNFGGSIFDGSTYWLETAVRPTGSGTPYRTLAPRQRLEGTPYALYAANAAAADSAPWGGLTDLPAGFADGVDDTTAYTIGAGLLLAGPLLSVDFAGSGSADTPARSDHTHDATDLVSGTLPSARLSGDYTGLVRFSNLGNSFAGSGVGLTGVDADLFDGLSSGSFWKLGGNSGTTAGTDFLGTSDNEPLEFRVNDKRVLRLESQRFGANIIGGSAINTIKSGVVGVIIAGGGTTNDGTGAAFTNSINASFAVVSGGQGNSVGSTAGTVGGGRDNAVGSRAAYSTVPGGRGASAVNYGQKAYASGSFAEAGDAQTSVYVLRNTTTDHNVKELYLDGSSERIEIPTKGRWTFNVQVVGASSINTGGYTADGVVENLTGTASLLGGTTSVPAISEDDPSWTVSMGTTNNALFVKVMGPSLPTTIRWVATVRTTEMAW